ncbi:MAG: hypothetical protein PF689_02915 [Deltaproteobacteria bacterium]|jgi:hypothetical protein|nr:hypothetical protein [Deltaproteobacteria bacterium]
MKVIKPAFFLISIVAIFGCTKTITVFSVKRKIAPKPELLVVQPQNQGSGYNQTVQKALSNSLIQHLGVKAKSYRQAWKSASPRYNNFFNHLYQASKKVFHQKSNSLQEAAAKEVWKDSFLKNLTLFGDHYEMLLEKAGYKPWKPEYLLVSGVENTAKTFSGNLVLNFYAVLVEIQSKEVFWGMSFQLKSVDNKARMAVTSINAGKKIATEINSWFKANIKSSPAHKKTP